MVSSVNGQEQRSVLLRQQQDALRQDLSANQASVQQNSSDKQANAADVQANSQAVEQNSQAQQSNAADIQSNNGSIQQTTGDIQTTAGNIQSTAQSISDANARKSGVNTELSNLKNQLSSVQDDPERTAAIKNDIQAAQMSMSDLDAEIKQLEADKKQLEAQKQQQEQDLAGFKQNGQDLEQTGAQLRSEGDALQQKGPELQQTGSQLEQTGVELEQTGAQIETQIADLDSQIAQAQAEEAMQATEVWEANQKKIDELGNQLVEEGTAVVGQQFAPGTTSDKVAEQSVSNYLNTMLNSDMFTDEDKQAFAAELAATLQNPKSLKALQNGDMETVMRDPAMQALINTKKEQIDTLNLNNNRFNDGYIDVPYTAGEQDAAEMREQYISFMFGLKDIAKGNVDYLRAGIDANKSEFSAFGASIRGFNQEYADNIESKTNQLSNGMRDVISYQDADQFVNTLNQINGTNVHISTSDIAQLFKDFRENPNDPSIKPRLLQYCGYERSANYLNQDYSSLSGEKKFGDFMVNMVTLVTPGGAIEGAGTGLRYSAQALARSSTSAKAVHNILKTGKIIHKGFKVADKLNDAKDAYSLFKSVFSSNN